MEKQTQNLIVKEHLESGKSITALEAFTTYGILRLGARIHNLINKFGMSINSERIRVNNKNIARYSLRIIVVSVLLSSCTTLKPGCRFQQKAVYRRQMEIQYEHSRPACRDGMRDWNNWWARPHKMTKVPFLNLYF